MSALNSFLTRRQFTNTALAASAIGGLGLQPYPARGATTPVFDLQHWSSTKGIHPEGGYADTDVHLVTYDGVGEQTKYYFEYVEGPWGYIVSAQNREMCVHPDGGATDSGNDTRLKFHYGRHPGAFFSFNQENGTIIHISGRYWHPYGGHSQSGNNNRLVLYDGWDGARKFVPTRNGDVHHPVVLDYPASGSIEWQLLFADDNPRANRTHTFTKTVGLVTENTTASSTSVSVKAEISKKLFGGAVTGKLSTGVTQTWSAENKKTWSEESSEQHTYDIKAGTPVAVWQKIYKASFDNGSVFKFFSATVTCDTQYSSQRPGETCAAG